MQSAATLLCCPHLFAKSGASLMTGATEERTSGLVSRQVWAIAAACSLGMAFSIGPMIFSNFGLFLRPITHEFGWSRSAFSGIFVFFGFLFALSSPFWGRAIDIWGARIVLFVGVGLFGAANALLALANGSLVQFYILFALISLSAAPSSAAGYAKVVSIAFDKSRGRAMALTLGCGAAAGSAMTPQAVSWLIAEFGWRDARLAMGLVILVVVMPLVFLLLRGLPHPASREGVKISQNLEGVSLGEALKTRQFWLILIMMFFGLLCFGAMQVHTVPLLEDRGVTRAVAADLLSVYALATLAGQVLVGFVLDAVHSPRVGALFFSSGLAGLLIIHHTANAVLLTPAAVLMGLCFGSEHILAAYFASRFFGMRAYGAIYGLLFSAAAIGSGLGPFVMGAGYDRFGSYNIVLIGLEIGLAVAVVCILMMGRYEQGAAVLRSRTASSPGDMPHAGTS